MRSLYAYLRTRDSREFPVGGCMHSLRLWVRSDRHEHDSRGILGYVAACTGATGHEEDHRTQDGKTWN